MADFITGFKILNGGLKGAMAGGITGLCVGAIVTIANTFLFVEKETLTYTLKGVKVSFHDMHTVEDKQIVDDLETLAVYKNCSLQRYNQGCRMTQKAVDIYNAFLKVRQAGHDGIREMAKFQETIKRADTLWRGLHYAVKDLGDKYGAEETLQAGINIQFSFDKILADMREEYRQNPQIKDPTKAGRNAK